MVHYRSNDSDESECLSSHSNSDSDSDSDSGGPNTMMSLLSSYYGVEDPSSTSNSSTSPSSSKQSNTTTNIDTIGFDHSEYVRKKFSTCEVHDLQREDTKLIHDIKTLDSDMQMLVYENYNKFISATETIKRMKTNVEAMDDDMIAVTSKMKTIIATTTRLDSTLTDKRSKIDKLARIKRLLTRLEFLSELPERLESMIEQGMYKQAIQLYNKTITVLTKQEQVLSFKKIKLKTENMMNDLRLKVLSLMDSSSMEAQQLTQYVGILKLMECSRDVVMEKFLAAHKRRSIHMIKEFMDNKTSAEEEAAKKLELGEESEEVILSVTTVRTFHQNVMVGLIESSNGVSEMFNQNGKASESNNAPQPDVDEESSTTMTLAGAYDELQGMIGIVMPDYIRCMSASLISFFNRYNHAYEAHQEYLAEVALEEMKNQAATDINNNETIAEEDEDDYDEEEEGDDEEKGDDDKAVVGGNTRAEVDAMKEEKYSNIRAAFKKINEERLQWIALTRQVILDCQYLDSGTENVRPPDCDASLPHADAVAEAVLKILDNHFNTLFDGHMQFFKHEVLKSIPFFVKHANLSRELKKEVDSPDAPSCRYLFPQRLFKAQSILDDLGDLFDSIFIKVCKDSRAIYETHAVSRVGKSNISGELMLRFCNNVAAVLESFGGVSIRPSGAADIFEESTNKSKVSPLLDYDSTSSTNSVRSGRSGKSGQMYNGHCLYEFNMPPETADQATACLLSAVVFSKVLPTLTDRLEDIMKQNHMSANVSTLIQEKCVSRFEDSCLVQLEAFIVYHADVFSDNVTSSLREALRVDEKAVDTLITVRDLSVTPDTLNCAQIIDGLTLLSCCLMLENLPAPQIRSTNQNAGDVRGSGDGSGDGGGGAGRRASVRAANSQAMYNYGLQLDIERMFSKKVNVFDADSFTLSLECVMGVVMKAAVKASMEEIRVHSIGPLAHSQLTIDYTFLKQVMGCVLKDAADVECLVEEVLVTLTSRSTEEAPSRVLPSVLPKAVSDGLYMAGKRCVLLR